MDIFFYIINNVFIPIIVAVITVLLTSFINNKSKKSKILVIYSKKSKENTKKNSDEEIIYRSYSKNIQFEQEFKNFLKDKNYSSTSYIVDLLLKTYKIYKSKEYKNYKTIIENDMSKICQMINYFINDYDFTFHIKRFQTYYENSFWYFKVINIGKSTIYNLNVEFSKESEKKQIISKDLLKLNEYININMIYFDFSIRINSFDFGYDIPFDFGYSKYTNVSYYTIKKSKYNKKDEILFKISYLDYKAKKYEYYFCSKEVYKNNTY